MTDYKSCSTICWRSVKNKQTVLTHGPASTSFKDCFGFGKCASVISSFVISSCRDVCQYSLCFGYRIALSTKLAIERRKNISFRSCYTFVEPIGLHDYPGRGRGGFWENSDKM